MGRSKAKFKAWDWDEGKFALLSSNNIVKAIYDAWNYEEGVFIEGDSITFCPHESIENNDEWLSEYGLGIKEIEGVQRLYDRSNGKVFENPYY